MTGDKPAGRYDRGRSAGDLIDRFDRMAKAWDTFYRFGWLRNPESQYD